MKSFFVASTLLACAPFCHAQSSPPASTKEQPTFSVETADDRPRVVRPAALPNTVLEALKSDEAVKSCLKNNPLDPGKSLGSWFIASVIHLAGPNEADLVVVPSFQGEESMCFESVSGIGLFWIFRNNGGKQYQLALRTYGNQIVILPSRTKDYRNVRSDTIGQAGRYLTESTFRFNGNSYVVAQERTEEQR